MIHGGENRELRWGILGAARIADQAILPAIGRSSNNRCIAIGSRNAKSAGAFAVRHSIATVYRNYESVLENALVDAVYIPLPNSLHKEWVIRALKAGKHVLCEKPLATNSADAEEMAAAAERSGLKLMEAFMYRFNPRLLEIVESVRNPIYIHAAFSYPLVDSGDIRLKVELGGGALLDVGCYTINVARLFMGEPTAVAAVAAIDGVDVSITTALQFPSGGAASLWSSFRSPRMQQLNIVAESGLVQVDEPFRGERSYESYQLMVESFAESVMKARPVAISLADSINNLKVIERVRKSARMDNL